MTAGDPSRPEGEMVPSPMDIVARAREREREIISTIDELREHLSEGNGLWMTKSCAWQAA